MENKKLIVSVCRGNIARSAVAEKIIENEFYQRGLVDKYLSTSRGIQGTSVDPQAVKFPNITYYEKHYEDSKPILHKLNIDLSSHISTPIDKNIAQEASILLAMDRKTKQALLVLFPNQEKKVHLFSELINEDRDIVDPEGVSGPEKQEKIFTEIRNIIIQGFQKLLYLVN
jgi:protein-tyrosine-phosphatase